MGSEWSRAKADDLNMTMCQHGAEQGGLAWEGIHACNVMFLSLDLAVQAPRRLSMPPTTPMPSASLAIVSPRPPPAGTPPQRELRQRCRPQRGQRHIGAQLDHLKELLKTGLSETRRRH